MRLAIHSVLLLYACLALPAAAGTADSVYLNGRIYTADPERPWVEAVAVADGRILLAGDNAEVRKSIGRATVTRDLGGRMAMPGIHDAHSHMLWGGLNKRVDCRLPAGADLQGIIAGLRECAADLPGDAWLIAGSVWSEQLPGERFHRDQLDPGFPNRPVYIIEGSHHHAFLNSRALAAAGITAATPAPRGGRIMKDDEGEPTGELVEAATELAGQNFRSAPAGQRLEALRWASSLFSRFGITSTQASSANAETLATLNSLDTEGELQQRVAAHIIWGSPKFAGASDREMEKLIRNRRRYSSPHVDVDFVKMWIDGSPTPPYFTEAGIDPHTGEVELDKVLIPVPRLTEYLVELDRMGIKVKMHVAGAGAAHVALDAVEAARRANPRSTVIHELGHTNLLIPGDFPRMKRLNVAGDMSPTIWHLYGPTLGNPPRPAWQFRTLRENGVLMTIGTDWPVTDEPNVFPAIQGLLDRGYESLDLDTALKMLTINGAVSLGWQDTMGSIEKDKMANLIVLDRHLFDIPPAKIGATQVLLTVFEGRIVYEKPMP